MADKKDETKGSKRAAAPEPLFLRRDDAQCEPAYLRASRLLFHREDGSPLEVPINQHFTATDAEQAQALEDLELPDGFSWDAGAGKEALGKRQAQWGTNAPREWTPNNPAGVLAQPGNMGVGGGGTATGSTMTAPGAPTPGGGTTGGTTATGGGTMTATGAPAPSGATGGGGTTT